MIKQRNKEINVVQIPFRMNGEILLLLYVDSVSIWRFNYDGVMAFVQMSSQPIFYL